MTHIRVPVVESTHVSEARRAAVNLATRAGFEDTDTGRVSLVVTECATNLVKHAGSGEILLRAGGGDDPAFEVLALDRGPGMKNLDQAFRDGYSTVGSAGTGLGAIRRLSSEVDIFTTEGRGTALLARIRAKAGGTVAPARRETVEVGVVSTAMPGESVGGDGWAVRRTRDTAVALVIDGLGHGVAAAECSRLAVNTFEQQTSNDPLALLATLHRAVRSTRGGAASVAAIDFRQGTLRFTGIGNVAGLIWSDGAARHMTSMAGILGHESRTVREFTYPVSLNDIVLLYSDGLSTHLSLNSYPGIQTRDAAVVAGVLYRDWNRGRDDSTVLVLKIRSRP
jgi:anti-sigma regulatory factor (Ser/Thr protein kinase)